MVLAEFRAPWSRALRVTSKVAVSVLLVIVVTGRLAGPHQLPLWRLATVGLPLLILFGALPFTVRGYVITATHIEVLRLGWRTPLPLACLISVTNPMACAAR